MAAHPAGGPSLDLALAVVMSSASPLLLLDGEFRIIAASQSFRDAFDVGDADPVGRLIFEIGAGEWDLPRLRSLLSATATGSAEIGAYEMDLPAARGPRGLLLNARRLDYGAAADTWLVLTITDMTDARAAGALQNDLLRQKAILLQEVQHRVANSLQIISAVILQSARQARSPEAKVHLTEANVRILSVGEVQRQLSISSLERVQLKPYLTQLAFSLGASMIRDHNQLAIEVDVDDTIVDPDVSVSIGLIVTELVINSLKHAFPGGRVGKMVIHFRSRGPNWTLCVADDGVGMPKDRASRTPGLGTGIVEALAKQLKAEVRVDEQAGTSVSIVHTQIAVVGADGSADEARAV